MGLKETAVRVRKAISGPIKSDQNGIESFVADKCSAVRALIKSDQNGIERFVIGTALRRHG